MKNKTVCFTGHRIIPPDRSELINERLLNALKELIDEGYCYFCTGGALGFDTMAALSVLKLKGQYPQIKLFLVLPCKTQAKGWTQHNIDIYEHIKENCDKFFYTSEEYTPGCMHKRNRSLVDNSSCCVTYLTNNRSGTSYTVKYARVNGLKIINVAA